MGLEQGKEGMENRLDANLYKVTNQTWYNYLALKNTISDAPQDGSVYGRKDGNWVVSGAGATPTLEQVVTEGNTSTLPIGIIGGADENVGLSAFFGQKIGLISPAVMSMVDDTTITSVFADRIQHTGAGASFSTSLGFAPAATVDRSQILQDDDGIVALTKNLGLQTQIEFITSNFELPDSSTFTGILVVKNVGTGTLNITTLPGDKLELLDIQPIDKDDSYTITKYQANDYRII